MALHGSILNFMTSYMYPSVVFPDGVFSHLFSNCQVLTIVSSALCYCTAALLSSCRCPSSVKHVFSEPIKQINATFGEKVPFHHISKQYFVVIQNFAFLFILHFFFCFSLTWDHVGEKLQTTSPLKFITNSLSKIPAYF